MYQHAFHTEPNQQHQQQQQYQQHIIAHSNGECFSSELCVYARGEEVPPRVVLCHPPPSIAVTQTKAKRRKMKNEAFQQSMQVTILHGARLNTNTNKNRATQIASRRETRVCGVS